MTIVSSYYRNSEIIFSFPPKNITLYYNILHLLNLFFFNKVIITIYIQLFSWLIVALYYVTLSFVNFSTSLHFNKIVLHPKSSIFKKVHLLHSTITFPYYNSTTHIAWRYVKSVSNFNKKYFHYGLQHKQEIGADTLFYYNILFSWQNTSFL